MSRGARSLRPFQHVPGGAERHGYQGGETDAEADPARVFAPPLVGKQDDGLATLDNAEVDVGGAGGTSDHTALTPESRAAADQHPASAITVDPAVLGNPNGQAALEGLAIALAAKAAVVGPLEIRDGDDIVRAKAWLEDQGGGNFQVALTTLAVDGLSDVCTFSLRTDGAITLGNLGLLLTVNPAGDIAVGTGDRVFNLTNAGVVELKGGDAGIEGSTADGLAFKGTKHGFFGANTVDRPEIPATPDAQDIADVLVALGLATQAAP